MKTLLSERPGFEGHSAPSNGPIQGVSDITRILGDNGHQSIECPKRDLPLVSIVIVNYNYGRFLRQAIDSVFLQTYENIECVVVDNGSTDESRHILAESRLRYPGLIVLHLEDNLGQTAGSVHGLNRSKGPFVIFLDADDFLLETCVELHIHAHLSARFHVGFTSGDMLQIVDEQVVSSTNEAMSSYIIRQKAGRHDVLRPYAGAALKQNQETLFFQVKKGQRKWIWAPMSGNCFRRDVLQLICDNRNLGLLRTQTDLYLATFVNSISGSILIDTPVFGYRIHDSNCFTSRPQLNGLLAFDPKRCCDNASLARRLIISHLVTHIDRFVQEPWQSFSFFRALFCIQARTVDGKWSYAADMVASHFDRVRGATGRALPLIFIMLFTAPKLVKLWLRRPIEEPLGPAAVSRPSPAIEFDERNGN